MRIYYPLKELRLGVWEIKVPVLGVDKTADEKTVETVDTMIVVVRGPPAYQASPF